MLLKWETWVYGLFSAIIGGGAGAVSAAIGVNLLDPKDWGMKDHPGHLFDLMGVCFCVNGAITAFGYLAKSPLPQIVTVTENKTTEVQPISQGGVKVTTATKTETESK